MNKCRLDTFRKELEYSEKILNKMLDEKKLLDARIIMAEYNVKIAKENIANEIGE